MERMALKTTTEKNPAFPSIGQAAVLLMFLLLFEWIAIALLVDVFSLRANERELMWSMSALLGNAALMTLILHYKQLTYRALFHASPNSIGATLGLLTLPIALLVPALVLTNMALYALLVSAFPISQYQNVVFERMTFNGPLTVIMVCILAPFLEEMLFRGIFLRSFLEQYPRRRAYLASALLFGAFHMNLYQFVMASLGGLLLAWLYEKSRSLWPCIALHAMYNSAVTLMWGAYGGTAGSEDEFPLAIWLICFVLAFAGASLLRILLGSRRTPQQ